VIRILGPKVVFLVPVLIVLLSGCGGNDKPTDPGDSNPLASTKGFGLSPQGFPLDYGKIPQFYAELQQIPNGGVMWNGAWRDDLEDGTDAGQIPTAAAATMESAALFGVRSIIVFGWRSDQTVYLKVPANSTNDWTNTEARELFLTMLIEFVTTYSPPLLFLGNENDFYFEQSPGDYANWIDFYETAYDTIQVLSPGTEVGPVFNYEHLAGAGALAGWTTPRWGALTAHDLTKIDVVGVTVYPFFHYSSPTSVPSEYLNPLVAQVGLKPLAITETGWPAEVLGGLNPPWEVSDTSQVAYVPRLSAVTQGILAKAREHPDFERIISRAGEASEAGDSA
jgi:hypothetical protein